MSLNVSTREFFCCYLLASLSHKNHAYIGFTVDPRRRIRQHNGEIKQGAKQTKKKQPWEFVCVVYGFPSKVSALQFEWAWQHPMSSRFCRAAARDVTGCGHALRVKAKLRFCFELLNVEPFARLPLTLHWLTQKYHEQLAGCPPVPPSIQVKMSADGTLDLPFYRRKKKKKATANQEKENENENEIEYENEYQNGIEHCALCKEQIDQEEGGEYEGVLCTHQDCPRPQFHVCCLAIKLASKGELIPVTGLCPSCQKPLKWTDLMRQNEVFVKCGQKS